MKATVVKSLEFIKRNNVIEVCSLKMLHSVSNFVLFLFKIGTIVSIGDPKKKYTRYEKIGQG